MEKELLKLAAQVSLVLVAVWVLGRAFGKGKKKHTKDPGQFSQASRVWYPSLVTKPAAEANSIQPQSALY